jgi:NADP-dependent aldehyde dehydrogenase
MGAGQFCTNPGLVVLLAGEATERFIAAVAEKFRSTPAGTLLSKNVAASLARGVDVLKTAGAQVVADTSPVEATRYCSPNTLLRASGEEFIKSPHELQTEAFGNASLFIVARDLTETCQVLDQLEGNLTGCVYSAMIGSDDAAYEQIAEHLRPKVGRLLNDKMPTGVAVSPAMNHGGPYPATGHPGFTAVGIPAAIHRFAMLQSFDAVRPHRLPAILHDKNPGGRAWRLVDGRWTKEDVS